VRQRDERYIEPNFTKSLFDLSAASQDGN